MSTINKKPYIKNLLESLDTDMLNSLSLLIDGEGNQEPIRRTMNLPSGNKTKITEADKGVHLCSLEINYSIFMGYLVYNDDYCCLIWFTDSSSQVIKCFNINLETNAIETVSEELSVLELRSELYDIRGGGSEVVANPTLEGTESNLEGLEVDGEKYKIPEGTVVEANPTLAGTEDALTGLQVGNTKYKVGGGSHLYKILITSSGTPLYYFTDKDNIDSITALKNDLSEKGFTDNINCALVFSFRYVYFTSTNYKREVGLYIDSLNRLQVITEDYKLESTDNVYSLSFTYPHSSVASLYQILKIY